MTMWLGGLFIPEAFITATRQFVAHANSWSLEKLYLQVGRTRKGVNVVKGLMLPVSLNGNVRYRMWLFLLKSKWLFCWGVIIVL